MNKAKCLLITLLICEIQGYWAAYAAKNSGLFHFSVAIAALQSKMSTVTMSVFYQPEHSSEYLAFHTKLRFGLLDLFLVTSAASFHAVFWGQPFVIVIIMNTVDMLL